MKRIIFVLAIAVALMLNLTSCTENRRAKIFGGTMTVELPAGEKLDDVTWKADELWYLTRERRDGEPIETFTFREESSYGVLEGTVIFIEK